MKKLSIILLLLSINFFNAKAQKEDSIAFKKAVNFVKAMQNAKIPLHLQSKLNFKPTIGITEEATFTYVYKIKHYLSEERIKTKLIGKTKLASADITSYIFKNRNFTIVIHSKTDSVCSDIEIFFNEDLPQNSGSNNQFGEQGCSNIYVLYGSDLNNTGFRVSEPMIIIIGNTPINTPAQSMLKLKNDIYIELAKDHKWVLQKNIAFNNQKILSENKLLKVIKKSLQIK